MPKNRHLSQIVLDPDIAACGYAMGSEESGSIEGGWVSDLKLILSLLALRSDNRSFH
jgi:hypothetical protein